MFRIKFFLNSPKTSDVTQKKWHYYQIVFEEAIKCSQFRMVFQTFLERHHSVESILFINRVLEYTEEYKKIAGIEQEPFSLILRASSSDAACMPTHKRNVRITIRNLEILQEKMNCIVASFLRIGGEFELNIGPLQKSSLHLWETTCQQFQQVFSNSTNDFQRILEEFNPGYLLGQIFLLIMVDLSLGHFTKFCRSDGLFQFLTKMGVEYVRKIGIDISKGYKVDLRFKPQDLKKPTINDEHIYFGLTLAQDTPDWKVVHEKKNLKVSTSRTSYIFDSKQVKGFKLCKLSIDLPYSLEDVWGMWTHQANHLHFEPMFCNSLNYLDYIEPNQYFHGTMCPYSIKIMTTAFDTKIPFLKKRYVETVTTCVKDSALEMYMFVLHSSQFSKGVIKSMPENFHLPLQNMTIGQVFKKRGKVMAKGLNFILDKLTGGGKHPVDTSGNEDTAEAQRCVNDNLKSFPDRSWYLEWKGQSSS